MDTTQINLADWYTNDQAVERLSANSGRSIDVNYPRTLAKYQKVRSLNLGGRGKLYWKADIDSYVVSEKRGRKPTAKPTPESDRDQQAILADIALDRHLEEQQQEKEWWQQ